MRLKLRPAVFAGLLLAQVATVVALVFVSGRLTSHAEDEHTGALLETALAESSDHVHAQIAPAESIVAISSSLASETDLPFSAFDETFRHALERSPQLAGVFIGTPDGSFTYMNRTDEGYRLKTIERVGEARSTELVFHDENGVVVSRSTDTSDTYDPSVRPWYLAAIGSPGDIIWTDPYVFFTSRQLGITAAQTIERDGEVVAVVGADIELGSLSTFLTTLRVGDEGGTIIVNQEGTVIAHPDPTLIQQQDDDRFRTVSVTEIDDPYARAAVAVLVQQGAGGGPSGDEGGAVSDFDDPVHGESRAAFRSVPVGDGQWTIGVFGPDNFLIGDLREARTDERWLTIAVGTLSVLLFGLVALPATRPIRDLETRARTDALTGLANRRAILAAAQQLADQQADRAAAMIDLDYFKLVNDSYGHQTGDEVLESVAQRIASAVRADATVGRVGGEEFLVVFPDMSRAEAELACERIQRAIRATPVTTEKGLIETTASIGLAILTGPCTRASLLSTADFALLQAKQQGRDQTVVDEICTTGNQPSGNRDIPSITLT